MKGEGFPLSPPLPEFFAQSLQLTAEISHDLVELPNLGLEMPDVFLSAFGTATLVPFVLHPFCLLAKSMGLVPAPGTLQILGCDPEMVDVGLEFIPGWSFASGVLCALLVEGPDARFDLPSSFRIPLTLGFAHHAVQFRDLAIHSRSGLLRTVPGRARTVRSGLPLGARFPRTTGRLLTFSPWTIGLGSIRLGLASPLFSLSLSLFAGSLFGLLLLVGKKGRSRGA